jgi:hypothetical protein
MVYLQKYTVKYDVDQEIVRNYENFDLSFSPFCKYLFTFGQIQKYFVFRYLDLTCSINTE